MRIERIDGSNAHLYRGGFSDDERNGFYVREMVLLPGKPHKGHSHYIDHMGLFLVGDGVRATYHDERDPEEDRGVIEILTPLVKIDIHANRWHTLEVIGERPVWWWCLFAKAEADRVYGDAGKVPWHMEKPHA